MASGRNEPTMSPNWEELFRLFQKMVASESSALQIRAIINLARFCNYAPENLLTCSVPILAQLLGSSSSRLVQEACAYCLKRMAGQGDDDRLAILIGQSGAIPTTLRLLQNCEGSFQRVLIKFLWSIVTFGEHNRRIVVRNGGLEAIVNLLETCTDSMRWYLSEIFSALAWLREAKRIIISLRGLRFLVEAVKLGGMASRERAAHAVGSLAVSKSARRALVDLGAMPALMDLFREGDGPAKLVAGNALGVISAHVDCIRPLARAGAIPLYAELLRGAESRGKEIAEDVFCLLAIAEVNAVAIAHHLVEILGEDDNEAKAAAAHVLGHLSSYKHSVSFIRNSGAIPILVDLLRDGTNEIKEKASWAISQLSRNAGDREALADAGAIPILIEILGNDESEEMRYNAVEALVSFWEDPPLRQRMSEPPNETSLENIHNRLRYLRDSEEDMGRSLRQAGMEDLTWDPDLF